MSLKFGIYLVEQRILTPEQFCGLVKIQQDATRSLASIAVSENVMTIHSVSKVLDIQQMNPKRGFIQTAIEERFMDRAKAEQIISAQEKSGATIRQLLVECGLMTQRQTAVLFTHFERIASRTQTDQAAPAAAAPAQRPMAPRAPKFKQRPVITSQYVE